MSGGRHGALRKVLGTGDCEERQVSDAMTTRDWTWKKEANVLTSWTFPPDAIALTIQSFVRPKSKSVAFTTLDNQRTAEAVDRSFGRRVGIMEAGRLAKGEVQWTLRTAWTSMTVDEEMSVRDNDRGRASRNGWE